MTLSRFRLRVASAFALTFAVGLALMASIALGYLWRESHRRLDQRLDAVARSVHLNLVREAFEWPDSGIVHAATEVVLEWSHAGDAFIVVDSNQELLSSFDRDNVAPRVLAAWKDFKRPYLDIRDVEPDYRVSVRKVHIVLPPQFKGKRDVDVGVAAFATTEGIESDTELVLIALAITTPLILLGGLVAGYTLAGRALKPIEALGAAVAAIAPDNLSHRLVVAEPHDEIGQLATEFNALLERLSEAQAQNRTFLREAAHQIRTPLTLVLGEAAHELASTDSGTDRMRDSLTRIRTAAEQMRRRVDELFLLAEAQAGEPVRLDNTVELDGLVLECADLMRGRAKALGQSLAIGRADHVVTRGSAALLQEALLELLENACRHGRTDTPVTVSVAAQAGRATLEVLSAGEPFVLPPPGSGRGPDGLGLPIVRWVAETHHGYLQLERVGELNAMRLIIPIAPSVDVS